MPSGSIPDWVIKPLTTIFVEVAIKVTDDANMVAKASGINNLEALTLARRANPITIGKKKAVEAVLLIRALMEAAATVTTFSARFGLSPEYCKIQRPVISTTPVRTSAAVMISKPRIRMTVSLPNPAKA